MKQVSKFFGLKAGDTQSCNGFIFVCERKEVLTQGAAPTLFGTLTTPTGEVVDYTVKGVFANKLNKIAGVANSVTIPAKVDNSQQKGENKVVSAKLSSSKQQKRFLKAYKLCKQASEVYGLTDVFSGMLEQLKQLDNYTCHCEEVKAQQLRDKMKAEAEAKKAALAAKRQAKEEAKKQAEEVKLRQSMIEMYAKKQGLTLEKAEAALIAVGII